jgi:hypothetical protein
MQMNFKKSVEFSREFKKLLKKYRTLEQDLDNFKKIIPKVDLKGNKNFAIIHKTGRVVIMKSRFFCRYLKGRTLRIIYAHYYEEQAIELIEIYSKHYKTNEDRERIKRYLK